MGRMIGAAGRTMLLGCITLVGVTGCGEELDEASEEVEQQGEEAAEEVQEQTEEAAED